jgi:hypothetical protein
MAPPRRPGGCGASGRQTRAGARAQVIDNARERWDKDADKAALRKRVTFAGGDFFKQGAPAASGCLGMPGFACCWRDAS